jgi:ATP-dependent Clp protease ATP-binding subunit ClpC
MIAFTPAANNTLRLAREEAIRLRHNFVGTEHLLLGLVKLSQGVAVKVLLQMGTDLETVRNKVDPHREIFGNPPYTPRAKRVLALAGKEAKDRNHTYVGTEHILLGLMREGEGVAARILKDLEIANGQKLTASYSIVDANRTGPGEGD